MKNKTGLFLVVAIVLPLVATLSLLTSCSDSASTAGVISETESGKTATLTITVTTNVEVDSPYEINNRPKVSLVRSIEGRSIIVDSAFVDSSNEVTFDKVPLDGFSIVARARDTVHAVNFASIITDKILESRNLLDDTGFVETHFEVNLYRTAEIRLNAAFVDVDLDDTVCIAGTLSCGVYDRAAQKSGYIDIADIPAATLSDDIYADYQQLEIIGDGKVRSDSVYWRLYPGDSRVANRNAVVEIDSGWTYTLPEIPLLDSLADKTLDSLIVPLPVRTARAKGGSTVCAYGSLSASGFMDAGQRDIPWSSDSESDDDSITTWVTLPPMDSSVTVYGVHGEFYNVPPMSRVQYAGAFGAGDTLYQGRFSEDSSFALSFWIKSVGSGAGLVFAEAKKGDVGFEIKQCPADTTALCTYVYNGGDSAETVPYGKAAILDGKLHHYSMVIHKKHLTIAVDGTALRDTDLKLSDDFYKLQGVSIGAPLKSLILYSFGDFIRKDGDKDWVRLKAWLKAFYEFQLNR